MSKSVKSSVLVVKSSKINVTPQGHRYESIESINFMNELNDLREVEEDFIMIAGMSPQEARQASINVGIYDMK
jgi:hypothetical protein